MIPTLDTPRLRLRPLADGDQALYCRLYGDATVMQRIGPPQSPADARRGFASALRMTATESPGRRFWVMQDRAFDQALGLIGLSPDDAGGAEVGVLLDAAHQGRGLATEAIAALAAHAFGELALQRLHTRHDAAHALAAGLMRTLGFEPTATAAGPQGWRWQLTAQAWQRRPGDKPGPTR